MRTNQVSTSAKDPESATLSFYEDTILSLEGLERFKCSELAVSETEPNVELIPTTTKETEPGRRTRSIASPSSEMSLFDNPQQNSLSVKFTAETHFDDRVSMDGVRNARRTSKFSVSRVLI